MAKEELAVMFLKLVEVNRSGTLDESNVSNVPVELQNAFKTARDDGFFIVIYSTPLVGPTRV